MKVPPKRKGNVEGDRVISLRAKPSMKVPPKRKGNLQNSAGCFLLSPNPQ